MRNTSIVGLSRVRIQNNQSCLSDNFDTDLVDSFATGRYIIEQPNRIRTHVNDADKVHC